MLPKKISLQAGFITVIEAKKFMSFESSQFDRYHINDMFMEIRENWLE